MTYSPSDKTTRAVVAIILLYTVSVYAVGLADAMDFSGDISDILAEADKGDLSDTEYGKTAKESFCLGVSKAVAEKFGLRKEDIAVRAIGFDTAQMRAQRITLILSGEAAYADYRAICEYVRSSGLGECEAEVNFG